MIHTHIYTHLGLDFVGNGNAAHNHATADQRTEAASNDSDSGKHFVVCTVCDCQCARARARSLQLL
jgi:hypothetical protein